MDGRTNLRAIILTASDPIEWVLEKEGDVVPYDSVARLTKERDKPGEGGDYAYFKNKGFEAIWVDLKDLLNRGVIYIAASAGNGLLMPDIGLSWWDPRWKLDHIGFGVIDFTLWVHQKEGELDANVNKIIELKKNYQANYPWKTYLVQDGQAIVVDGDMVEHIGPGTKMSI